MTTFALAAFGASFRLAAQTVNPPSYTAQVWAIDLSYLAHSAASPSSVLDWTAHFHHMSLGSNSFLSVMGQIRERGEYQDYPAFNRHLSGSLAYEHSFTGDADPGLCGSADVHWVHAPDVVGSHFTCRHRRSSPLGDGCRIAAGLHRKAQLPVHAAFNRSGYSPEFMLKLLRTDWVRKAADAVPLAATAQLLHQLLSAH